MEPICWAGIVGVVAIAAVIGSFFKGSCKNSNGSSCGCGSKAQPTQSKEKGSLASGIDDKKEKAINDLIK